METLLWIVGLLVIAAIIGPLIIGVIAGGAGMAAADNDNRKRDEAERNPDPQLDDVFDGASVVHYDSKRSGQLRAPVVIAGAIARGYDLIHDDDGTLTFKRGAHHGL